MSTPPCASRRSIPRSATPCISTATATACALWTFERGLDRRLDVEERLRDQFPGVDFGTLPDLPAVDGSSPPPGADPVRLGSSNMVAFTAEGTSTPGSLYVRGPGNTQFVVRILGETGKIRILRFDRRSRHMETVVTDRRRARRRRTIDEHGIVSARVRPGHEVALIRRLRGRRAHRVHAWSRRPVR